MSGSFAPSYKPLSLTDASSDTDDHEKLTTDEAPNETGIGPDLMCFNLCLFLTVMVMLIVGFVLGSLFVRTVGCNCVTDQLKVPDKNVRFDDDLDAHGALTIINTTRMFNVHPEYVLDSEFADAYWLGIQPAGGLVSIDTQRAFSHGLPPSLPSPANPNESIYQMAVYHSLHCLNRLRHRIFAPPNASSPFPPVESDQHTIHCVDHLRQALTCKPDVRLGATKDYESWGLKLQHHCQDYEAVKAWVERHALKGLPEVLDGVRSRKGDEKGMV